MTLDIVVLGLSITSSWGNGHAGQGPTAAAIANAIADATGLRLRDLPLDRARLRTALGPIPARAG